MSPKWEEDKWLLVQEPKTQIMRAQVFDHDAVNLKVRQCHACRAAAIPEQSSPVAPSLYLGVQALKAVADKSQHNLQLT